MRFLQPDVVNWLAAIPIAFAFWWLYARVKARFRHRAAIGQHRHDASRLSTRASDVATLAAAVAAIAMLVLAMARPQMLLERQVPEYEQHDLILMLDRSASMYAQDIAPSRFSRAIDEIKTFVAKKPEGINRVALIGFAGTPVVLSRLTADQGSLFFYLDWMREDERVFFGTDIGATLDSAVQLAARDREDSPKIFVLLSDGEDQGDKLSATLGSLQRQRVRVHTIGIGGDSEVPITVRDQGKLVPLLDDNGRVMATRFAPTTLTNVASLTGGRYFRSVTGTELTTAMNDIVSFERKLTGWTASVEYRDMHRPALAIGAFALALLLLKL